MDDSDYTRCPRGFELRANNGAPVDYANDGDLIHTVSESGNYWSQNEEKCWTFVNGSSYTHYWIYMTDKQDPFGKGGEFVIQEIEMFECQD